MSIFDSLVQDVFVILYVVAWYEVFLVLMVGVWKSRVEIERNATKMRKDDIMLYIQLQSE
jgi:hypothetical protein